ncbi:MAG: hypothetical protein HYR60_26530 [Acidobacteria bacterium]|nr:hypothetical protein [Acidobacteriota bacterium]
MIAAILGAQWASLRNLRLGTGRGGAIFSLLMSLIWYGFWAVLAYGAYAFTANPDTRRLAEMVLPRGLMFVMGYWQLAPVLVASLGASLDLKKLLVYPIPLDRLFWVEVLLRLTTGVEMLMLVTGTAAGLIRNPVTGGWPRLTPVILTLAIFTAFNLLLAAGLRNLIERLLAHKRLRELLVVILVVGAALPQLLVVTGVSRGAFERLFTSESSVWLPWTAAARLFLAPRFLPQAGLPWAILAAWTAAAYFFGRWQFGRSLRFDIQAAQATAIPPAGASTRVSRADVFFRFPAAILPDPLAAMVEKELRTLVRSPRFRLVFIMGFTFGLVIWLPMLWRSGGKGASTTLSEHFLTLLYGYALILLGQVSYWNAFGFDRSAVQVYFSLPVPMSRTLLAKNLAALIFVVLEMLAVTASFLIVGTPAHPGRIVEAFLVNLVVALYLIAAGNLSSVHLPRAMNPERSVQGGAGNRAQALILVVYPVALLPVVLAYAGRYAFNSDKVFYALLAFAAGLGAVVYWVAMDSSVQAAERKRERIVAELSRADGPVAAS